MSDSPEGLFQYPTDRAGLDALNYDPEIVRSLSEAAVASYCGVGNPEASAEDLPFPDDSFDVVISNGVFNLIPDKSRALMEVFRVLKPRRRLMIADQIVTGELPKETKIRVDNWAK